MKYQYAPESGLLARLVDISLRINLVGLYRVERLVLIREVELQVNGAIRDAPLGRIRAGEKEKRGEPYKCFSEFIHESIVFRLHSFARTRKRP